MHFHHLERHALATGIGDVDDVDHGVASRNTGVAYRDILAVIPADLAFSCYGI